MTDNDIIQTVLSTQGKAFAVEFRKRSDGQIRKMVCRIGVLSHLEKEPHKDQNGHPTITMFDHRTRLFLVWDFEKHAYRSVPIEGIQRLKIGGVWIDVTHDEKKPVPRRRNNVDDYKGKGVCWSRSPRVHNGHEVIVAAFSVQAGYAHGVQYRPLGYAIYRGDQPIYGSPQALLTFEEIEEWFTF